jgi:ribosomal protein S18 acetylase RimI-like enzyme
MSAGVAVRAGTRGDRDFVRDLGRRSATSSISAVRSARQQDVLDAFDHLATFVYGRHHDLLIAERDGERVGFLLLVYDIPDEVTLARQAFVAYMAVEPAARHHGAGRALLENAELRARAEGLPHMSLMVTDDNAPARALYEGAGYSTERRLLSKPL